MLQKVVAGIAIVAALALSSLSLLLASIDTGHGASPGMLALSGSVAELGTLVVLLYAYAKVSSGAWAWAGRISSVVGMGLLFAGDATQTDGLHVAGNLVFYATLILLGGLMWRRHAGLGAFAAFNGLLGYASLAFAPSLGLPDELNLLVVAIWLAALAVVWLRTPWRTGAVAGADQAPQPA